MQQVIVTGGNHHNTYGVIRSLGKKNITPFLLLVTSDSNSFILRSKFISNSKIVENESMAINFLLDNKDKLKKSIVIACSDGMSSALDINRNKLSDYYKLPGSNEQGRITYLMDKNNMSNLGEHVGFSIPRSWLVESINDIADVEYPCISKPLISKDGSKNDIVICEYVQSIS